MILRRGSRHFFDFNPRPPRGGRLNDSVKVIDNRTISIHAPREGGDCRFDSCTRIQIDFNPRPPRGGRLHWFSALVEIKNISIHAPREGGDETDR